MSRAVNFIAGGIVTFIGVALGQPQLIYTGLAMLAGAAAAALTKKPKLGRGQGLDVNYSGTIEPRQLIYGTLKVGGMHNIPPISTGEDGKYGHADIVVAGHEVDDITDVYFDKDVISDASIGAVTGTIDDGLVGSGKYANKAWIRRYLGTATQTADYLLRTASSNFTADFRLRGNAHVAVQCEYDSKVYNTWPGITVIVKGQKVYDPRLDTTKSGGAGSHREDDATTWAHSANPILLQRHFLVNEVGFSHAELSENEALIMASANVCDASVNIPGGTQKRWTCNIRLAATDPWEDNLRLLVDACEGHSVYIDGKWYLYAGAWQTPDVTIDQGDWISPMQVTASVNRDERWNFVRPWYVDPDRSWQRVEAYPRRNSAYETADGGERIPVEIEMPYCASSAGTKHAEYEAQRHGEHQLRKSRNQIKVSGVLRPEFAYLIPGNTVYVNDSTYGWVNKTFRIAAVESGLGQQDGGASVGLIEEADTIWTDLASGDYNTESVTSALDPGATLPRLTADPTVIIGATTISLNIGAGVPSTQPPGTEYAVISNPNSNWPPTSGYGVEVWRGTAPSAVLVRANATTAHYWMQANVGTYKSEFRPNSAGIPIAPYSYGPAGLTISQQPTGINLYGTDGETAASRLNPTSYQPVTSYLLYAGNNGAVTFSWQVLSYWFEWWGTEFSATTPTTILPHTVTNNGSQHPNFYHPTSLAVFDNGIFTRFKVTLKDTSTTLDSNTFITHWKSGAYTGLPP